MRPHGRFVHGIADDPRTTVGLVTRGWSEPAASRFPSQSSTIKRPSRHDAAVGPTRSLATRRTRGPKPAQATWALSVLQSSFASLCADQVNE
jgi:hypothetical protein